MEECFLLPVTSQVSSPLCHSLQLWQWIDLPSWQLLYSQQVPHQQQEPRFVCRCDGHEWHSLKAEQLDSKFLASLFSIPTTCLFLVLTQQQPFEDSGSAVHTKRQSAILSAWNLFPVYELHLSSDNKDASHTLFATCTHSNFYSIPLYDRHTHIYMYMYAAVVDIICCVTCSG